MGVGDAAGGDVVMTMLAGPDESVDPANCD